MRKKDDSFELSATDLVGYLNCRHLSDLERAVAEGVLKNLPIQLRQAAQSEAVAGEPDWRRRV
jgi:hypothetical protein